MTAFRAAEQAEGLFDIDPAQIPPEPPKLSPDARRTQWQAEILAAGYHPLSGGKLHPEAAPADDRTAPGRRCGNCRFREVLGYHQRSYAKCVHPGDLGADEIDLLGPPRVTHGAASDCRSWWPGCTDHTYGDRVSDDAARHVPEAAA